MKQTNKYLMICAHETGTIVKFTDNLDDFKTFCHYCALSDWNEHKKYIKEIFKQSNIYEFTGNDVSYYIISDYVWNFTKFKEQTLEVK